MEIQEVTLAKLDAAQFIEEQVEAIAAAVGNGTAVNALSGGVDSSTVTMLGHRALGDRLRSYFIDHGLIECHANGRPLFVVEREVQRHLSHRHFAPYLQDSTGVVHMHEAHITQFVHHILLSG